MLTIQSPMLNICTNAVTSKGSPFFRT